MELKSYTCPHCGGVLQVKEQLKVYRCEYCGVTYDYDYFKEDSLLKRADVYLKKREFLAAKEAYEFLLEKEPDNAKAYKRLLLVAQEFTDIKEFRNDKIYIDLNFPELKKINDRALKEVEGKDRAFFEAFEKAVLEQGQILKEARIKQQEQQAVLDQASNAKNNVISRKETAVATLKDGLGCAFVIAVFFTLSATLSLIGSLSRTGDLKFSVIVLAGVLLVELLGVLAYKIIKTVVNKTAIKDYDEAIEQLDDNEDDAEKRFKELKKAADQASFALRNSMRVVLEKDPDKN